MLTKQMQTTAARRLIPAEAELPADAMHRRSALAGLHLLLLHLHLLRVLLAVVTVAAVPASRLSGASVSSGMREHCGVPLLRLLRLSTTPFGIRSHLG